MSVHYLSSTNSHYIAVPISIAMPLQRSDAITDLSDPYIILGPRKCHPTERLLENGDPLIYKKARDNSIKENYTSSSMPTPTHLTHIVPNPERTTTDAVSSDCSDERTSDDTQAIMVDDNDEAGSDRETVEGETTDKNDDTELGT
jgi:hypothetical protein